MTRTNREMVRGVHHTRNGTWCSSYLNQIYTPLMPEVICKKTCSVQGIVRPPIREMVRGVHHTRNGTWCSSYLNQIYTPLMPEVICKKTCSVQGIVRPPIR
ncbi:uncharacterized protein LOC127087326 isoform X6 [Lathyrus oleraceus]|uniref:uncharacterized protein LOC127087326 isoform X3 n=1 Tax=Pisum sativum TaxID=3888 RepID=UPI0021D113E4|nr:uncharacterized protein LOC127087326 isoform X3 [Pisum sativum]XP_050884169.1 uncharacterized protein LOC127087326 isoform X4 [Pisum sativum]XP_050884170.1 uncharacterized protein LOC127087326 isoform X5 [Pisum sativum]XP_050884171.1 uncharacterized protein LOC127087326 isoform X6 [Pisum sativum]